MFETNQAEWNSLMHLRVKTKKRPEAVHEVVISKEIMMEELHLVERTSSGFRPLSIVRIILNVERRTGDLWF